jgi:hypothetical protein
MPTLAEIRQRILRHDASLGRVETIASLTTSEVTVDALATGSIGAGKFSGKWILRPSAASTADRLRITAEDGYNAALGSLRHAGQNYADTTATSEVVEIHEHEPFLLDNAVQSALSGTRFLDRSILPTRASDHYSLSGLSWIAEPSDISSVTRHAIPLLNNNRGFEKWNGYSTAGALVPDNWTIGGSGATFARSTTTRTGAYSLSVTRAGTNATFSFTIPVLDTGVDEDSLRGDVLTVVLVGRSGQANSLIVAVASEKADGTVISTSTSDAHTGGGGWEELSVEHTVSATADRLTVTGTLQVDETALIDECYLVRGSLTDDIRRNNQRGGYRVRGYTFEQGQPPLLRAGAGARGGILVIETQRPYATFVQSRINAGTADADSTDAPLDLIAYGALFRLYEDLPESMDQARKAEKYRRIYSAMQAQHLAVDDTDEHRGADLIPAPRNGAMIRRVR